MDNLHDKLIKTRRKIQLDDSPVKSESIKMNKLNELEKKLIEHSLLVHEQDREKTAKDLGISVEALERKIQLYNIGVTSLIDKAIKDASLSVDDRNAINSVFGKIESVPMPEKKKKKSSRRYYKNKGNGNGYKQKYLKLLKEWQRLTD